MKVAGSSIRMVDWREVEPRVAQRGIEIDGDTILQ